MRIETAVTRLLAIDLPILQAGMSWASSDAALPLAVSAAGALGVISAGPMRAADLARVIDAVAAGGRPYAVDLPLYRPGRSAGLNDDIVPAGALVARIAQEYAAALGALPRVA